MGAVANQRPDLFGAVVSGVGVYDMLRVETTPNGAFNVTEFGSVKDPEQFKALHAYSPLHQVQGGAKMPAMLLTTGLHDGRVAPWMSFKMAARLQAASGSGRPVLLRVAADAGHGQGTRLASSLDLQADELAFFFSQLGMR
jgi:prolyl oligopeptidase